MLETILKYAFSMVKACVYMLNIGIAYFHITFTMVSERT